MKIEKITQRKATRNQRREEKPQVAVTVDIPRRREASVRPATRDRKVRYRRMKDSGETLSAEVLNELQQVSTQRPETIPP